MRHAIIYIQSYVIRSCTLTYICETTLSHIACTLYVRWDNVLISSWARFATYLWEISFTPKWYKHGIQTGYRSGICGMRIYGFDVYMFVPMRWKSHNLPCFITAYLWPYLHCKKVSIWETFPILSHTRLYWNQDILQIH